MDGDWMSFDPTIEHGDSALVCYHVAHLLAQLKPGITFSKLLSGGGGFIREQVR